MITVRARSMSHPQARFADVTIERREVGTHDIRVDIDYAGICHTDVHHARAEFGVTHYPIVPGHEITGTVSATGSDVTKFRVGDKAGVGCLVDSCRECGDCKAGFESYCRVGKVLTYNAVGHDGRVTLGGYSEAIVVDECFAVLIPETMALERVAPLLCAGITMYSPLRKWGAGPGKQVAIVGFGGLGHIGVQISHAFGARTTVINKTDGQFDDAMRMGANEYRSSEDPATFSDLANAFDLIVSTVPASYDLNAHLNLLAREGVLVNLGVPETPLSIEPYSLLTNRRSIAGSMSGGMPETQEMINFCSEHRIGAEVEIIEAHYIDTAFDRLVAGDVRYRFVIDASTFAKTVTPEPRG
jgi:uncharacterized zinc-type alcohol dehydrogenase-like protein